MKILSAICASMASCDLIGYNRVINDQFSHQRSWNSDFKMGTILIMKWVWLAINSRNYIVLSSNHLYNYWIKETISMQWWEILPDKNDKQFMNWWLNQKRIKFWRDFGFSSNNASAGSFAQVTILSFHHEWSDWLSGPVRSFMLFIIKCVPCLWIGSGIIISQWNSHK